MDGNTLPSISTITPTFEKVYRRQSSWVVPESRLRDEMKISVAREIGPAYRSFYGRHRATASRELGALGIFRYAPDDLDNNYWLDLFYRPSGGGSSPCSSSRSSVPSSGRGGSNH